jgi:hypothetical protein
MYLFCVRIISVDQLDSVVVVPYKGPVTEERDGSASNCGIGRSGDGDKGENIMTLLVLSRESLTLCQ